MKPLDSLIVWAFKFDDAIEWQGIFVASCVEREARATAEEVAGREGKRLRKLKPLCRAQELVQKSFLVVDGQSLEWPPKLFDEIFGLIHQEGELRMKAKLTRLIEIEKCADETFKRILIEIGDLSCGTMTD